MTTSKDQLPAQSVLVNHLEEVIDILRGIHVTQHDRYLVGNEIEDAAAKLESLLDEIQGAEG